MRHLKFGLESRTSMTSPLGENEMAENFASAESYVISGSMALTPKSKT